MVGFAGGEPAFGGGGQVGLGYPDGSGYREPGQRLVWGDDVDLVGDEPEPVAEVADAGDGGRPGGGEDEPDRVVAVADAQWVDLYSGRSPAMVGQTSSMWAPRIFCGPGPRS